MTTTTLKRQFITDAEGNPIAVILPMEEFALVKDILDRRSPTDVCRLQLAAFAFRRLPEPQQAPFGVGPP